MRFKDISPFIRHVEKLNQLSNITRDYIASYDHIMVFILNGSVAVSVQDDSYTLNQGSLLIIKPGVFYRFEHDTSFELILVHFDFNKDNAVERAFYLKPVGQNYFNPDKICSNEAVENATFLNSNVFINSMTDIRSYVLKILSESKMREKKFEEYSSLCLKIILIEALRISTPKSPDKASGSAQITKEILKYIHDNYNKNIDNKEIARIFGFHPKYINILVKNKTGYPIHKYVLLRRISKAIELLQNTNMLIYEIAEMLGFADVSHFSKCFKQMTGKSPREYREKH